MNLPNLDDFINPIAVKELRQAVKGKFISWAFIIYLVIQLFVIGLTLMVSREINRDFEMGRTIFNGLLSILFMVSIYLITAYTALRFSSERSDSNVDLLFITSLKPVQIIWGKLLSAIILTLLFFTASLPFMTMTFFLRGLDLPSVFIILILDFLIIIACIQFGIFLASLPGKLIARVFRFLFAFLVVFIISYIMLSLSFRLFYSGIGSSITTWSFWAGALTSVTVILLGIGLFFLLSVTAITPASANRALPLRLYIFVIWLVTGIISFLWFYSTRDEDILLIWSLYMMIMFSISMFVVICERHKLQPRVAVTIPKNIFLRIPAFLLYSGAAGGIVYCIVMVLLTILTLAVLTGNIISFYELFFPSFGGDSRIIILLIPFYALCYALTAFIVKRILFRSRASAAAPAVIALIIMIACSFVPLMLAFFIQAGPLYDISTLWYIGNPMVLIWKEDIWPQCLSLSGFWAAIVLSINVPWIMRQIKQFKPLEKAKVSEAVNE